MTLVRNPRYDPRTDSRAARENNPDRFVFVGALASGLTHNVVAMLQKLADGELDHAILTSSPKVIDKYADRARRHVCSGSTIRAGSSTSR